MAELDTLSYWLRSASIPEYPALGRDLAVDAAVIGGGITGITAAYLLKASGLSVALVERDRLARVDTGNTTAHLTMVTDLQLNELVSNFGKDAARAVWDAGRLAIDQIESHIDVEGIECDFKRVPGFLHEAIEGEGATRDELKEVADLARELGFEASFVDSVPHFKLAGVRFGEQALFHPRKYLAGLARTIPGNGSHIFANTSADEITDDPLAIKCGEFTITCDYVVIATHTPLMGKTDIVSATVLQSKLALYTSYAVGGLVPTETLPHGLYWDTTDPYHYVRVEPRRNQSADYVIFGGEDHKTGQVDDTRRCYDALEKKARKLLPSLQVTDRWSGQVIETNDGLPYIGETSDRQFAATGYAGNGMTFGTLAAMMARDAAVGRVNPWKDLFSVDRTKLFGGTWDYVNENKDYLYYLVRDRFAATQGASVRVLKRGEGKILNVNGQRAAAYRDQRGTVIMRSAICTHMGCEVRWNKAEATWDCPCHGSRFKTDGSVLAGPAESPLPELNVETKETEKV
jgi:glycine/D-amino acid oxidase-like deaminating enzyme/nitrite reductase/ring-hydroxylating ferredoxin subunit